jgi:hypothetical protein
MGLGAALGAVFGPPMFVWTKRDRWRGFGAIDGDSLRSTLSPLMRTSLSSLKNSKIVDSQGWISLYLFFTYSRRIRYSCRKYYAMDNGAHVDCVSIPVDISREIVHSILRSKEGISSRLGGIHLLPGIGQIKLITKPFCDYSMSYRDQSRYGISIEYIYWVIV